MMITRYLGVYWLSRKEELPGNFDMCIFHVNRTKPHNIHFGGYSSQLGFFDQEKGKWYDAKKVDYWMAIPVLPEKVK